MSIVEFETDAEWVHESPYKWNSKRSVDLDWVGSASPYAGPRIDATSISMCGSSQQFVINCPYSKFMMMWRDAKGARCR